MCTVVRLRAQTYTLNKQLRLDEETYSGSASLCWSLKECSDKSCSGTLVEYICTYARLPTHFAHKHSLQLLQSVFCCSSLSSSTAWAGVALLKGSCWTRRQRKYSSTEYVSLFSHNFLLHTLVIVRLKEPLSKAFNPQLLQLGCFWTKCCTAGYLPNYEQNCCIWTRKRSSLTFHGKNRGNKCAEFYLLATELKICNIWGQIRESSLTF